MAYAWIVGVSVVLSVAGVYVAYIVGLYALYRLDGGHLSLADYLRRIL